LKKPQPHAQQISNQLVEYINQLITQQGGSISFATYMQQALFAPNLGFYCNGLTKFGVSGDFITAPLLGSLFAKCLAQQIAQLCKHYNFSNLLEIGAGTGQLAIDLLQEMARLNIAINNYYILEPSAELKFRQQQLVQQQYPTWLTTIKWLDSLPNASFYGIILANEVLDAFPVNKFQISPNGLQEFSVVSNNNALQWTLTTPSTQLQQAINNYNITTLPYESEINLLAAAWLSSLEQSLAKGIILLCDYGYKRSEYYHPDRQTGTLMCHYQHHCHTNPLLYPGLQDITAHVDFTLIAETALKLGLTINGYTNLASFLINCGLTSLITNQYQEARILSSPAEMGELFKVIALGKQCSLPLIGFSQYDKRHNLITA